jgi:hypothetical protein
LIAKSLFISKEDTISLPTEYKLLLLVSAVIESVSAIMSGRAYPQYVMSLWPTLTILAALAIRACSPLNPAPAVQIKASHLHLQSQRLLRLTILVLAITQIPLYSTQIAALLIYTTDNMSVVQMIRKTTLPTDKVAILGGPGAGLVYLYSERFPTSPYFYQLPIVHSAYEGARQAEQEFVNSITTNPPKLIASEGGPTGNLCETVTACMELNQGIDAKGYNSSVLPLMLQPLIAMSYVRIDDPKYGKWEVYLRRDVSVAQGFTQPAK